MLFFRSAPLRADRCGWLLGLGVLRRPLAPALAPAPAPPRAPAAPTPSSPAPVLTRPGRAPARRALRGLCFGSGSPGPRMRLDVTSTRAFCACLARRDAP